jgi:hypothetical protein
VDGKYRKLVETRAAARTTRKVVYRIAWATASKHTIEIRVRGTSGRPRVDLDAFVVLR